MDDANSDLNARIADLRELLAKFRIEEYLVEVKGGAHRDLEREVTRGQQRAELDRRLRRMHAADLAHALEALTPEERRIIWLQLSSERRAEVMLELSDAVLEYLIEDTPAEQMLEALASLDADDIAYLGEHLPPDLLRDALDRLSSEDRRWVRSSIAYPEDRVGHLMNSEMVSVRRDATLQTVRDLLLERGSLPDHTDKLFVIDRRGQFCGTLFLQDVLLNPASARVEQVMKTRVVIFRPSDAAMETALAFERYDLISAPVINERDKLVGRLTVDAVMDFVRAEAETDALNVAGVVENEDLFASVWASAKNRWLWLSVNLVSAFAISRIIGAFESTIAQLVALASLMPIVASVAGNTGNQTTALVVRNLALGKIHAGNIGHLMRKELAVAILNGVVWGVVVGAFAFAFYQDARLSSVVAVAMMISIALAAVFGVGAPVLLHHIGRDPAMGSSVILTGLTDAMGFFVFLLLAAMMLV
jgi:magnesium transporter